LRTDELYAAYLEALSSDYLGAYQRVANDFPDLIEQVALEKIAIAFIANWFIKHNPTNQVPDTEQSEAVALVHGNCQVVARAGSGKNLNSGKSRFFPPKALRCEAQRDDAVGLQQKGGRRDGGTSRQIAR
jgi:hypothetical protein